MAQKMTTRQMNVLITRIQRKRELKKTSSISVPRPDWHIPAMEELGIDMPGIDITVDQSPDSLIHRSQHNSLEGEAAIEQNEVHLPKANASGDPRINPQEVEVATDEEEGQNEEA